MTVTMRNGVTGDVTPLEMIVLPGDPSGRQPAPLAIPVNGFGHVVVGRAVSSELIVRLSSGDLIAALFQPVPGGGEPRRVELDPVVVEDVVEIELLRNSSGEDRLVVCVPLDVLPAG